MSDFTEGIVKDALDKFHEACNSDEELKKMIAIVSTSSSYDDVYKIAKQLGGHMADVLIEVFETFSENDILYGTARQILEPTMRTLHDLIAQASEKVQENKYEADKIRVATTSSSWHPYYSADIAENLTVKGENLENLLILYAQQCVDRDMKANIELSTSLGYDIVIVRKYDHVGAHTNKIRPDPCKWCISRQGTKRFANYRECQYDEIWDRHPGCGCTIDYYNRKTGTRNRNVANYNRGNSSNKKR